MLGQLSQRDRVALLACVGALLWGSAFYVWHTLAAVEGAPAQVVKGSPRHEAAPQQMKEEPPLPHARRALSDYAVIMRRNLFRPLVERKRREGNRVATNAPPPLPAAQVVPPPIFPIAPAKREEPQPPAPPPAAPEPPKPPELPVLSLRLAGIVEEGQQRLAFIEDATTQRSRLVQVGDIVQGAQILQIEPTKVTVQKGEFPPVELPLTKGGSNLPPAATQRAPALPFEQRVRSGTSSNTNAK